MISSQDNLIQRYVSDLDKIDEAMFSQYGERYLEYRRRYKEAGEFRYEPEFPLYIMLEQTYACNLSCPSCIQGLPQDKRRFDTGSAVMSWSLFEQIILECEQYSCPSIAFHVNDEPLLVKDLPERVAFAKEHGFMDLFITTNGNLLSPDLMIALIDAGVTRILFSLDAATPETYEKVRPGGNFSRVMENLETLLEYRKINGLILPAVRASFVISKLNVHECDLFIDTFSSLVDYVEMQTFSSYYSTNIDLIPPGAELVKDFLCNEPWRKLIIRSNGDVLPCCTFYGYEIVLGNVLQASLKDIFQGKLCRKLRQDFKDGNYRLPACKVCTNSFYKVET